MKRRDAIVALVITVISGAAAAQAPSSAPQPTAVTHTAYSRNTELFAEWRPLIIGEATRLTAHLTRTGDRFKPYAEGNVTLTLTVEGVTAKVSDPPGLTP